METLIGFAVGYLVGTRHGREGLEKARESLQAIRNSPETRRLVLTGVAVAGGAVRQVLGGGAGAALSAAMEAIAHKAMPDTERRAA